MLLASTESPHSQAKRVRMECLLQMRSWDFENLRENLRESLDENLPHFGIGWAGNERARQTLIDRSGSDQ